MTALAYRMGMRQVNITMVSSSIGASASYMPTQACLDYLFLSGQAREFIMTYGNFNHGSYKP
jgi:hypothetical protein